ncbi:hypothetical protein EIP86_003449 [Pleurotus ostreatoroseus]|nr:hypothetical protein EIP86_003449 [Pleurotus ostreatoroseus]
MHALSHSLAHRGPGASRARTRFQPYSQLATQPTPSTRSPQGYLHTPASSTASSTPSSSYSSPLSAIERIRKPINQGNSSLAQVGQLREAQKSKYVTRLVGKSHRFFQLVPALIGDDLDARFHVDSFICLFIDQAVNSLCEIWKPEDIPHAFRTTSQTAFSAPMPSEASTISSDAPTMTSAPLYDGRNIQLPSPVSPSTQPSPVSTSPYTPTASITPDAGRTNHSIPIRGFVHEVLRRSRISTGVLQTALCYLEAVRGKVPEQLLKEQAKATPGYVDTEEDPGSRIVMGSPADFEEAQSMAEEFLDRPTCRDFSDFINSEDMQTNLSNYGPPTAPLTEPMPSMDAPECAPPVQPAPLKKPSPPLPPLPPLPSPLLCPRRTFLACLILASKFMQDRSYSNRAWAKLAGLPPREIGRCERALGEALEWRLWVGKGPAPASAPAPGVGAHRAVTRCRSEATLNGAVCSWICPVVPTTPAAMYATHSSSSVAFMASRTSGLKRSSTMPAIGTNGSTAPQTCTESTFFSSTYVGSSTLPGERKTFADSTSRLANMPACAGSTSWLGPNMQQPSPSMSTPILTYSPASTVSSEEYERTVQMPSIMDMPEGGAVGSFDFGCRPSGLREEVFFSNGQSQHLKLPALKHAEPAVASGLVRLPSISEVVPNPALVERGIEALPEFARIDSGSDFRTNFATWSMRSMPSLCHRPALKTRSTLPSTNAVVKAVVVANTLVEYGKNRAQCATPFAPYRLLTRRMPDDDVGTNMDLLALTAAIIAKNKCTQGPSTFRVTGT